MTGEYRIGPFRLRLAADDPVGPAFAHDFAALSLPGEGPADFEVEVRTAPWGADAPFSLPGDAWVVRWGSLKIYRADEAWYLDFHETAFFRVRPGKPARAEGVFYRAPHQDKTLWVDNVLVRLLALLLRFRGATLLHASGFACDEGAVLFVGANGTGKTTLSLALAPPGGYLGDDLVVWDGARVGSFPKPPRVGRFAAGVLRLPTPRGDEKREIPPPPHFPGGVPVARIWFPEIRRGADRLSTIACTVSEEEARRRIEAAVEHTGVDAAFGSVETEGLVAASAGRLLLGTEPAGWRVAYRSPLSREAAR